MIISKKNKPFRGTQLNKSHPLSHELRACWLFNEVQGKIIHDYSGNGNHGRIIRPGTALWNTTTHGYGVKIDPGGITSGDYINIPASPTLDNFSNGLTVYAVITGISETLSIDGIIGKRAGDSTFAMGVDDGDRALWSINGVGGRKTVIPTGLITDVERVHTYVGIFRPGVIIEFYRDGILLGTNTTSIPNELDIRPEPLWIGTRGESANPDDPLLKFHHDGIMIDIRIWGRDLSINELSRLYSKPYDMFMRTTSGKNFLSPKIAKFSGSSGKITFSGISGAITIN